MEQLEALRLAAKLVGYLFLFGGGGALGYLLLVERTRPLARPLAVALAVAGAIGALAVLPTRLALEVVFLGGGWPAVGDAELWALVLDTPPGRAALAQAGGLALVALAALARPLRWPAGLAGAGLVVVGQGLSGHAAGLSPAWAGQALLALHLLGVGFWLGSLWPLHRAAAGPADAAAAVLERFSRLAVVLVGLLVAAGLALAAWLVGSVPALIGTTYGLILLAKLALVALLLGLAAANKWRLVPRLAAGDGTAARRLRLSIRVEMLVALGILAATAALTTVTGPPG